MNYWPFLIASRRDLEFEWIVLPDVVPVRARRRMLENDLPVIKHRPNAQCLRVDFGSEGHWTLVFEMHPTLRDDGLPYKEESGRVLHHVLGALVSSEEVHQPIDADAIVAEVKPSLTRQLASFMEAARPQSLSRSAKQTGAACRHIDREGQQ